jgi:hypothetical protein
VSGYLFVFGPCYGCRRMFSFSAERVPSIVVDGQREPICQECVDRANLIRVAEGLPPIVPLPGAYEPDEAGSL